MGGVNFSCLTVLKDIYTRVPEIHSDFPLQVFNECYFRCSIVKATGCWKIICGTEAPSNVLSVFVVYLTFLDCAAFIMLNSVYIYMQLSGAGLCGWNGPVSPLEVFYGLII